MSSFSRWTSQSRTATTSKTDIVNGHLRILEFAFALDLETQFPSIIGVLWRKDLTHSLICEGAKSIKVSAIPHFLSIEEGVRIAEQVKAIVILHADVVYQLIFVVSQGGESLRERSGWVA